MTVADTVNQRRRTRLSPDARREQLVEIGARLFAERPFNDVWIEEVASEAGVSRALIYHYFPNKRDFYAAIIRHGLRNTFDLTAPDESLPPERWLISGIERLMDYVEQNADAFRAVYRGRHSVDEEVREAIREGRDAQVQRMSAMLSPNEPASVTIRMAIEGWIAMFDVLILDWLDNKAIPREQLVQLLGGSLTGIIVTALQVDGRADQIATIRHLAPDVFPRT
jgi:AcrR family transcriptional regulator